MYDPLFSLGGYEVAPFTLALLAGGLAACGLFLWLARRGGLLEKGEKCLLAALPLSVFLGHLLYCLALVFEVVPTYGWLFLLQPWRGGYMFYGCALGMGLAVLLTDARCGRLWDLAALSLLFVLACARFAEPLDGQGRGIDLESGSPFCFFPVAFANPEWPDEWNLAVFFWEGLYALGVVLALTLTRARRVPGETASLALLLYASAQILFETLRRDETVRWRFVRVSQLLSALILGGFVLLCLLRRRADRKNVLRGIFILLLAGIIVALEFSVDKPLELPGGQLFFFPYEVTYPLIGLCGALMGLIAFRCHRQLFARPSHPSVKES